MIDIQAFKDKQASGTASIVRLQASFPEAAAYAIYTQNWDSNGQPVPDEVTAIRLLDVDEFRSKLALEATFLAELDAMVVQK